MSDQSVTVRSRAALEPAADHATERGLASCGPAGWTYQSGPWLSRTDQARLVGQHDGLHAVA
jgi:hypothetical protein